MNTPQLDPATCMALKPVKSWRDEVRLCPVCKRKYWPDRKTTYAQWQAQEWCNRMSCLAKAVKEMKR
jgi:hypothetical protein